MKKRVFPISGLIVILSLFPFSGYSQASAIIPVTSISDWENAGVQGGIPEYPAGENVHDYGATGDGTTNDTKAVLDAIAACSEGNAVYFPPGTYIVTESLVLNKSIVLRGAGPDKTKIISNHGNSIYLVNGVKRAGVEDLHIHNIASFTGFSGIIIEVLGAENSWVINTETSGYAGKHISLHSSSHCEVRDNYFHISREGTETVNPYYPYGISIYHTGSDYNLIQNNIVDWFRHGMDISGESGGIGPQNNVFAYNFSWFVFSNGAPSTTTDMCFHINSVDYTLVEGNLYEQGEIRDAPQNYNTIFRNRINNGGQRGGSESYVVGNEFVEKKHPGTWFANSVNISGTNCIDHGNYETIYAAISWDPTIDDHDIPDSYYLTEKPSWFGDLDWPPYGGDLMPGNMRRTPAEVRYWTMLFPEISPSNLEGNVQGNDVILTWHNNSTNEVDFIVCRSTNGTDYQRIGETTNTTYTDKITDTGQYHYYVRARNHLGGRNYYGDLHGIDLGGESDPSNIVTVGEGILSVEQGDLTKNVLSVYPNPANEMLNFDFPDNKAQTISIYSGSGKLISEKKYMNNSVNISGLEKGMYFLLIKGSRKSYHAKFIIE